MRFGEFCGAIRPAKAEKIFREMGFSEFKYRTVDAQSESNADTICYIEITEWFIGDSDFVKGDKFDAAATVTFFYYSSVIKAHELWDGEEGEGNVTGT